MSGAGGERQFQLPAVVTTSSGLLPRVHEVGFVCLSFPIPAPHFSLPVMLRQILPLGLLLLASARLHGLVVDSAISAVTVYPDRAAVTRTASVAVPAAGPLELEFTGLPAALSEQSLQFSGRGTARITILDVAARPEQLAAVSNERIRALEDELASLSREARRIDAREALLSQQESYLHQIRGATIAPQPEGQKRPEPEDWARGLAFITGEYTRLSEARLALSVDREALQQKTDLAKRQLAELRGTRAKAVKRVLVRLDASAPGQLELSLGYTVPGAAWSASYNARLLTAERAIALDYFGLVRNGTGEDWDKVALTLSTARPSLGGAAPEVQPWLLDVYAPPPMPMPLAASAPVRIRQAKAVGVAEDEMALHPFGVSSDKDSRSDAYYAPADVAQASLDAGATSASFRITTPVSLRSDSTAQKVPVTSFRLPAALEHQVAPKFNTTAYLSARVTNASEFPLVAGPANLFIDEAYIASSALKAVAPGEAFDLSLGADEALVVKRRLVNRFAENTGLTGKGRRVTYEYAFTLTNNRATPERLVLTEPFPVSRNEKITVALLTPAEREVGTKAAPRECLRDEEGRLVWHLDLKAGEKREFTLKFQVDYPSEIQVSGLE